MFVHLKKITIAISVFFVSFSTAFADAAKLVEQIPVEIPQVLSGGLWKDGDKSGPYRAVVVNSTDKDGEFATRVFLQWISIEEESGNPSIVKTVAIKEVNSQLLSNAFIYLDGEEEDEIILVVTSYDPDNDNDKQTWVKATSPGNYKIVPAETDTEKDDNEDKEKSN